MFSVPRCSAVRTRRSARVPSMTGRIVPVAHGTPGRNAPTAPVAADDSPSRSSPTAEQTRGAETPWEDGEIPPSEIPMKQFVQSAMVFFGTLIAAALVALGEPASAEVQMLQ